MKKKEKGDLSLKTVAELKKLANTFKEEIVKLQLEMAQKKVKNVNELRTKMKNRARVLTILNIQVREEKVKEGAAKA